MRKEKKIKKDKSITIKNNLSIGDMASVLSLITGTPYFILSLKNLKTPSQDGFRNFMNFIGIISSGAGIVLSLTYLIRKKILPISEKDALIIVSSL